MCANPNDKDKVKGILDSPDFTFDLRGKLSRVLDYVDDTLRTHLVCDFIEHILWIYAELSEPAHVQHALDATRQYLEGEMTCEELRQFRPIIRFKGMDPWPRPYEERISNGVGHLAQWLIDTICPDEPDNQTIRRGNRVTVQDFAFYASLYRAQFAAGEDWDSTNRKRRNAARTIGRKESDAETKWQLDRVREYLGLE